MLQLFKENAVKLVMTLGTLAIIALIGVYFSVQTRAIAAEEVAGHEKITSTQFNNHSRRIGDLEKSMIKVVTIQQEQSKTFNKQLDRFDKVLIRFEDRLNSL